LFVEGTGNNPWLLILYFRLLKFGNITETHAIVLWVSLKHCTHYWQTYILFSHVWLFLSLTGLIYIYINIKYMDIFHNSLSSSVFDSYPNNSCILHSIFLYVHTCSIDELNRSFKLKKWVKFRRNCEWDTSADTKWNLCQSI